MALFNSVCITLLALSACLERAVAQTPGSDIPLVSVNTTSVTVSGISAGAFMAVQMHVAFSTVIKASEKRKLKAHHTRARGDSHVLVMQGAGILAGGPFYCAQDDVLVALGPCMEAGELIPVPELLTIMAMTEASGFIDPLSALADSRVWMLSAMNDSVVARSVVEANAAVYSAFLANPSGQMTTIFNIPGEHAQLTNGTGSPCTYLGSPYINNCGYDAAGHMLQWLYRNSFVPPNVGRHGKVACRMHAGAGGAATGCDASLTAAARSVRTLGQPAKPAIRVGGGTLYEFNQGAFVGGGGWSTAVGLAENAYVYIPDACLLNCTGCTPPVACTLHTAFHGCEQTTDLIGETFMLESGYLPWADANNIVVLFPQAIENGLNPKGCFDWWGYAGPQYASNIGTQTLAVRNMLNVLMQHPFTPNRTTGLEDFQQQLATVRVKTH